MTRESPVLILESIGPQIKDTDEPPPISNQTNQPVQQKKWPWPRRFYKPEIGPAAVLENKEAPSEPTPDMVVEQVVDIENLTERLQPFTETLVDRAESSRHEPIPMHEATMPSQAPQPAVLTRDPNVAFKLIHAQTREVIYEGTAREMRQKAKEMNRDRRNTYFTTYAPNLDVGTFWEANSNHRENTSSPATETDGQEPNENKGAYEFDVLRDAEGLITKVVATPR